MSMGIDDNEAAPPAPAMAGGIPDDNSGGVAPVVETMGQAPVPDAVSGLNEMGAAQTANAAGQGGPQAALGPQPQGDPQGALEGINQAGASQVAQSAGLQGAAPGGRNRVASMVMGADAAPPQVLEQAKRGVDPHNTQPPGNQVMMAIDAAVQKGDSKGAIALLQSARQGFNARQSFAFTALNGTPQKPADLNAAIDAANQAEQYVPDGSNVKFSHGRSGEITATVTMAGTDQTQTIPLTADQFKQFLNVGVNHFDRMYSQTVPATLQQIASGGSAIARAGGPAPKGNAPAPDEGDKQPGTDDNNPYNAGHDKMGRSTAKDPWARKFEDAHGDERTKFNEGTDDEMMYRANRMFPNIGEEKEKQAWITAQQEAEAGRKNKLDVEVQKDATSERNWDRRMRGAADVQDKKNTGTKDVADIKGEGYKGRTEALKDIAHTSAEAKAKQAEARNTLEMAKRNSINVSNADRVLVSNWNAREQQRAVKPFTEDEEKQYAADMEGVRSRAQGGGNIPSGKPAAPPSGQAAPPPSGKSRTVTQNGHTYTLQADGSYK